MDKLSPFDASKHDPRDPDPWLALYLDDSIPLYEGVKQALMRDNNSWSRKYLFPLIAVWSKVTMFLIHIFKYFIPKWPNSSRALHNLLSWGLKRFVSRDANYLIFRHFHVGTEILSFVAHNIPGTTVRNSPLRPKDFKDVKDDLFLNHDLNLYNFIINLNRELKEKNIQIGQPEKLNLDMVTEEEFDHIAFPNRWTNILDLRSAIEIFTPFYQLFLTSNDFLRASNSLQLDETIGIYTSKILNSPGHIGLINNRHPMVPDTTYSAGFRLVLHGLAAESLHAILVSVKGNVQADSVIIPG